MSTTRGVAMKKATRNIKAMVVLVTLAGLGTAVWAATKKADTKKTDKDCAMPDSVRKQILAKVGKEVITVGSFADEINRKSPYLRARYESIDRRKELLKNIVRRELLAEEAARKGLDKDPDVQRTMKQVMIQKLLAKVYKERVESKGVTDEELQKFYKDHFKEYNKPEQVRISVILVPDKAQADKVLAEANKAKGNMRTWRELVRKYSQDKASKIRGGDLRYFDAQSTRVAKPLVEAAFKMAKPGQITGPIKTDKGWYVIRLTHRRKAFKRTLDEVKDQITQRILRQKRSTAIKAFIEELKKKAKIKVYDNELASLKVDTSAPIRMLRRPGVHFKGNNNYRRRRHGRPRPRAHTGK